MTQRLFLDALPQEVLEDIAYNVATDSFLGPPSALTPLLLCNRPISVSISANHHLYARIFKFKFDTSSAIRRLGNEALTSSVLASELRRRCILLKGLRARSRAGRGPRNQTDGDVEMSLFDLLSLAYVVTLEDEGKNRAQLGQYGKIKEWLHEFWFDAQGASLAVYCMRTGKWPFNGVETSLAMWLFYFFLDIEADRQSLSRTNPDETIPEHDIDVLKTLALGAHIYQLTSVPWTDFRPTLSVDCAPCVQVYDQSFMFVPPPLATPAIMSYLALVGRLPTAKATGARLSAEGTLPKWETEWRRSVATTPLRSIDECFTPGCIEGVWEGFFTYIDFATYAALLGGAGPSVLTDCVVGRHKQLWKLQEHHLLARSSSDFGVEMDFDETKPLSGGDPLRSYFPTGVEIREHRDGVIVQHPGQSQPLRYTRASYTRAQEFEGQERQRVLDIIVTGQGHSSWGQFNLVGRVRPCDGFVSLSKDYVDGDRGKWLYRGYLVGNGHADLAGRWRDTLSPTGVPGYEGCFLMERRR